MTERPSSNQTEKAKEPLAVSFSVPQIIGGALAAATAAAIGSHLGVAGTIIGASVASVVGGVAGTLYSAGIDRTHRRVTSALRRDRGADPDSGADVVDSGADPDALDAPAEPADPGDPHRRRHLVKRMVLSVAAIFVIAVLVVTAIELGLGKSLDGSGGTTVSEVTRPKPRPSATQVAPSPQPTTPSPTATQPSASATQPSASTTPEPSPTSAASTTEQPSATPSSTAS